MGNDITLYNTVSDHLMLACWKRSEHTLFLLWLVLHHSLFSFQTVPKDYENFTCGFHAYEPLPGVLGNTGTVAFIFREQGIFSNYFQGTGELLTRLLGSREHQFTFNNGQ